MDTKKTLTLPKLPLIKGTTTFEMFIPKEVESKIRHLCSVVHNVEWSGTLFYTYSGNLDDGTFKVTCVDLFVMDIGSSGYTEFKESADVISYRIEHDLLGENIMEGLIHSHNTMPTFFSSTDCATLAEEGNNTNHFVSLIVNNEGKYTAAVTRKVITQSKIEAHIKETGTKYYHTYDDAVVILEDDKVKEEDKEEVKTSECIEYYDLDITKEEVCYFEDIDSRLDEIRKVKDKRTTYNYASKSNVTTPVSSVNNNHPIVNDRYYHGYPYDWGNDWDDDDFDWKTQETVIVPNKETSKQESKVTTVEEEVPLCLQESFDEDLVKHLCLQLLTGSIIINDNAIAPADWVKKMDVIYEKRFGLLDYEEHPIASRLALVDNNSRLEDWIGSMVEFLVYTRDENLLSRLNAIGKDYKIEYDESDTAEVCAYCMKEYLEALPASYVKDVMVTILTKYIPDGVKDYI